jgi:hypothetical protein
VTPNVADAAKKWFSYARVMLLGDAWLLTVSESLPSNFGAILRQ